MKRSNTMKTALTLATMAAALTAVAVPAIASAQTYTRTAVILDRGDDRGLDRRDDRGWNGDRWDNRGSNAIDRRIDMMQDRLNMGRRDGALGYREAARLNANLRDIIRTKHDFERSGRGLDGREANILNARLDDLADRMHFDRHNGNRW